MDTMYYFLETCPVASLYCQQCETNIRNHLVASNIRIQRKVLISETL